MMELKRKNAVRVGVGVKKPVRARYILIAAIESIVVEGAKGTCVVETYQT